MLSRMHTPVCDGVSPRPATNKWTVKLIILCVCSDIRWLWIGFSFFVLRLVFASGQTSDMSGGLSLWRAVEPTSSCLCLEDQLQLPPDINTSDSQHISSDCNSCQSFSTSIVNIRIVFVFDLLLSAWLPAVLFCPEQYSMLQFGV